MSTISTNPRMGLPEPDPRAAGLLRPDLATPDLAADERWGGLSLSAWIKIGIVAVLMAALFRFNLSRLWLKTNPITGQENWAHAFFIPLIGLYYLFVHRDELIQPHPYKSTPNSMAFVWGIAQGVAAVGGGLMLLALPQILDLLESVVQATGLLALYHGWRISPLYLVVPYAVATAVAAGMISRRPRVARKIISWAEIVWPVLVAWFMTALVVWGAAFFIFVISQRAFGVLKVFLSLATLVSLVAVLWTSRGRFSQSMTRLADRIRAKSSGWLGGFILGWGVLFSLWGIWPGQNDFFKDVGMVIALFGVVTVLAGWGVMRTAWFPILFLFCGLPWPDQVYSMITGPLQHFAAAVAVRFLTVCNVPSMVVGTKIIMDPIRPGDMPRVLNVEQACAGLKSLMMFVTMAAGWAFVFMSSRPLWHRLVLAASAAPIAIFCNVMRVSGTGLLDRVNHQWSDGFAHKFVGLILLVPAFFLILLVGWVLDHLFIEEADDVEQDVAKPGSERQRPVSAGSKVVVVPTRRAASSPGANVGSPGAKLAAANITGVSSAATPPASAPPSAAARAAAAKALARSAATRPAGTRVSADGTGQAAATGSAQAPSTEPAHASVGRAQTKPAGAPTSPADSKPIPPARGNRPGALPGQRRQPDKQAPSASSMQAKALDKGAEEQ